jgi:hypothetical protein
MIVAQQQPSPWPPDAAELRRVAEAADGLRDQELTLVIRRTSPTATPRLEIVPSSARSADDVVVCPVETHNVMRERPRPFRVLLQVTERDRPLEIQVAYDALFWSEPAIEKFFFPYYRRVLRREVFRQLESEFYDGDESGRKIVAFGHLLPTIWVPFVGEDALLVYQTSAPEFEVDLLSRWFEANRFRPGPADA